MKERQRFSVLRNAALTACVVLGCFVLAFGAAAPSLFGYSARADETVASEAEFTQLSAVTVSQKSGWVFADGQTERQLRQIVDITVSYTDPNAEVAEGETAETNTYTLEFEYDELTAETGETVSLSRTGNTLTVTVTVPDGYTSADGGNVGTLENIRNGSAGMQVGIYAAYNGNYAANSGTTVITIKDYISVYPLMNDAMPDMSKAYDTTLYNTVASENLFPDDLVNDVAGGKYSKRISVVSTDGYTTKAEITDITFTAPHSLGTTVTGSIEGLIARQDVNLLESNVMVRLLYGSRGQTEISVPISSFGDKAEISNIQYFEDEDGEIAQSKLTTAVHYISFEFEYLGELTGSATKTVYGWINVSVSAVPITAPSFPDRGEFRGTSDNPQILSYHNGVGINVALPDYSEYVSEGIENGGLPEITITVTHDQDGQTITDQTILPSEVVLGANGELGMNGVTFGMPNTPYTVNIALKENSDFQWRSPEDGGSVSGSVVSFRVFVDKDKYTAELDGSFDWVYEQVISVGSSVTAAPDHDWVFGDPSFELVAHDDKYDDEDYSEPTVNGGESVTVPFKYYLVYYKASDGESGCDETQPMYDTPTEAGKYKVKAVTIANEYYYGTETPLHDFTIEPKGITVGSVLENPTYDRSKQYDNDNVLKSGVSVYGITVSGLETPVKYYKADGYAVSLTIGNTNYYFSDSDEAVPDEWISIDEWASLRSVPATFEINKRTIKYAVTGSDAFYYGDVDLLKIGADVSSADAIYLGDPNIVYSAGAAADCDTWDHGDYYVVYTPVYVGGDEEEKASLDLVASAEFDFVVKPAEVTRVNVTDRSVGYDKNGNVFEFENWVSIAHGGLGSVSDIQELLTRTIEGNRTGTKTPVYSDDDPSKVTLFDVDTYNVTVSLPDGGNFVWAGGGTDSVTAEWIITKAVVSPVSAPDGAVYDHAPHELTLDGEWDPELMEKVVTGVKFADGGAIVVSGDDKMSASFTLTDAGTYRVEVSLVDPDNYEWSIGDGNHSNSLTLAVVIARAAVTLDPDNSEAYFEETADGVQQLPELNIVKKSAAGGSLTAEELTLEYEIRDAEGTLIPDNKITESGVYTFTFTGATGTEKYNYDYTGVTYTYTILTFELDIPDIENVEFVYDGDEHNVFEFIKNYADTAYNKQLVVTVDDGAGLYVKNVKGDELSYAVSIEPATSYSWKTGEGQADKPDQIFGFTVTVTRLAVEVRWGSLSATYGDTALKAFDASPEIVNNKDGENLSVTVGYKAADKTEMQAFDSTTNAGAYYVYVKALELSARNNYEIVSDYESEYKIYKRGIERPIKPDINETYGGETTTESLASIDDSLVLANLSGYRPGAWFDSDKNTNRALSLGPNDKFDVATGKLTYTHAGVYTVTFTIENSANYCWSGDGYEDEKDNYAEVAYTYAWTDFATIDRLPVTIPALGASRAQEWGDGYDKTPYDGISSALPADIGFAVKFGGYNASGTLAEQDTAFDGTTAETIGQYYIEITISESNMLDYVWGDFENHGNSFVEIDDTKGYADGKVYVRIQYAITSTQLPIEFKSVEYVFGDNGVGGSISTLFDALELTDETKGLLENAGFNFDGNDIGFDNISFAYRDGAGEVDIENDLLPWNVGEYYMYFTVIFKGDKGANYQSLPVRELPLTVSARVITVAWSGEESVEYDGEEHTRTATATNLAERAGGVKENAEISVSTVRNVIYEDDGVTPAAHTVTVLPVVNSNYTKDGMTGGSAQLVILPRTITVTGANYVTVYGEAISASLGSYVKLAESSSLGTGDGLGDAVEYKFVDDKGNAVEWNIKTAVDLYSIVPVAKAGGNYALSADSKNGVFEVKNREITVTLNPVETTYYDEISDYKDGDGNYLRDIYFAAASTTNGSGDAFVDGEIPFAFTSEVRRDSAANPAGYVITATQTDDNYIVTFVVGGIDYTVAELNDGAYKHIVNKADFTIETAAADDFGYKAENVALVKSMNASGVKNAAENEVRWYIAAVNSADDPAPADGTGWEQYDATKHYARNAGTYYFYIKAEAVNHNTPSSQLLTVTVSPAELDIKLDLSIFYSEQAPESVSWLMGEMDETHRYIENAAYKVTGLVGSDGRGVITGAVSYTTDYAAGDHISDGNHAYAVNVNVSGLVSEHGNYTFNAVQGVLTVNPIVAEIVIDDKSCLYNAQAPEALTYQTPVVKSYQTYAITQTAIAVNNWNEIFKLGTAALIPYKDGASTAKVGEYIIYADAVGDISENYTVTFIGTHSKSESLQDKFGGYRQFALYTIEAASLEVDGVITPYTGVYDDLYHDALTVPTVTASDGAAVGKAYYVYAGNGEIDPDRIALDDISSGDWESKNDEMPQFINAGTYYVFYSFTAENYAAVEKCAVVVIDKNNDNAFATPFSFANGKQLRVDNDYLGTDGANAAWTYGKRDGGNPDGYDGSETGGQYATQPVASVKLADGAENKVKITLLHYASTGGWTTVVNTTDAYEINDLLLAEFGKGTFVAGVYKLVFELTGTDNYNGVTETYLFAVDKATLTVTPNDASTVYGEAASYSVTIAGFVVNGATQEDLAIAVGDTDVAKDLTAADSAYWNFTVDGYTVSSDYGSYTISVSPGVGTTELFKNYSLDCVDNENGLTVGKRVVTINISNQYNHYMLLGEYANDEYAKEDYADLTGDGAFTVEDGEFYNGEIPFTLATAALEVIDGNTLTADAGEYAIYAVFKDGAFAQNYTIEISNPVYSDGVIAPTELDGLITDEGRIGGVYTISPAELVMTVYGPYYEDAAGSVEFGGKTFTAYGGSSDGATYDGKAKYFNATPEFGHTRNDIPDDKKPTEYVAVYSKRVAVGGSTSWQTIDGAPTDAGTYRVVFKPSGDNNNYVQRETSIRTFDIGKRKISQINLNGENTVYNGDAQSMVVTFQNIVDADLNDIDMIAEVRAVREHNGKAHSAVAAQSIQKAVVDGRVTIKVTAVDALMYDVSIRLGNGENNYELDAGATSYTFNIALAPLNVTVKDATVQYGTEIFDAGGKPIISNGLFDGFYVEYGVAVWTGSNTLDATIEANQSSGEFTKTNSFLFTADGYRASGTPSAAGDTFDIALTNLFANNFDISVSGSVRTGTLKVTPREIIVNVNGVDESNPDATVEYNGGEGYDDELGALLAANMASADGRVKFLEASVGWNGATGESISALGISLAVNPNTLGASVVNAGKYYISAEWTNRNYSIDFVYNGKTLNVTIGNAPRFEISKATLYVKVQSIDTDAYDTATGNIAPYIVESTYGDSADVVKGRLAVRFSGWKAGDGRDTYSDLLRNYSVAWGISLDNDEYSAYLGHVGQKYVITGRYGEGVTLDNYDIVYVDAELDIKPLEISVSTDNRTYETDGNDYHGGVYGKPLEAIIVTSGEGNVVGDNMPKFTLTYDTESSEGQTKFAAPVKVGNYTVTVTINANGVADGQYRDYVYADGSYSTDLAYGIEKREIELAWSPNAIDASKVALEDRYSYVNFVADIMSFVSLNVNNSPFGDYVINTFENDGKNNLEVSAMSIGTYVLTVNLTDAAYRNYYWRGFADAQATAILVVNGDGSVTIVDFEMIGEDLVLDGEKKVGWIYGNETAGFAAKLENNDGVVITTAEVAFEYARLNGDAELGEFDGDANGLDRESFKNVLPTDAALYVVRASFAGDRTYAPAASKYYVFRISKKSVDKPALELNSVYDEKNGVIDISRTLEGFDASSMRIVSSSVNAVTENGVVTLSTTLANANGYAITIGLANGNYVWNNSENPDDTDNVTVVWKVAPGQNKISWKPGESNNTVYGATYTLTAFNAFTLNGTVNYWYATRADGEDETDAAAIESWLSGFPVNAGKYWIRAVGSSANGNYTTAYGYLPFEVKKADLNVTPSGSYVYGTAFDTAKSGFTFTVDESMLVNNDSETVVRREINGSLSAAGNGYALVTDSADMLGYGTYDLTLDAVTRNYNIIAVGGTLAVGKKTLTVRIGDLSSYYGKAISIEGVDIGLGGLIADDSSLEQDYIASIRALLATTATAADDVGGYRIYIDVSAWHYSDNYTLGVTEGTYTVAKLPIVIEYERTISYEYGSADIKDPERIAVKDYEGNVITVPADFDGLLNVSYLGYDRRPVNAGTYTFTVTVSENCNYTLYIPAGGTFRITQRELDANAIVWETVYYDGSVKAPKPTNTDVFGDVDFENDIEISYDGEWINAGTPYIISLTLKNTENTKWKTIEGDTREIVYTISRGTNSLVGDDPSKEPTVAITGWTYGNYTEANAPSAKTAFGDSIRFEYSTTPDFKTGTVLDGTPVDAGTYYVRAVVEESVNWERFESDSVEFTVAPLMQSRPTLGIYSETSGGHYKNDTYTGDQLGFEIFGFDSTLMEITYDGYMVTNGNNITLLATNAGGYEVVIRLKNGQNYNWSDVTGAGAGYTASVDGGELTVYWTIAKKKLAAPTANDHTYIVNGSELVYIPEGFDSETMSITGNVSGYGGDFKAYVSLIDPDNYEWENGLSEIVIEWHVVGAEVLFAVLVSVLSVLAAGAAVFACVELVGFLKKKKKSKGGGSDGGASGEKQASNPADRAENAQNAENATTENAQAQDTAETNNEGKVTA